MLKNAEKCDYTPPLGEKNGRPVLFPHKKSFCKPCAPAGSFDRETERLGGSLDFFIFGAAAFAW